MSKIDGMRSEGAEERSPDLTTRAKQTVEAMNSINALYQSGHDIGSGKRRPGTPDENDNLEAGWGALNDQLFKICTGIFREVGGEEALVRVESIMKQVQYHIRGGLHDSTENFTALLKKAVVDLTRK